MKSQYVWIRYEDNYHCQMSVLTFCSIPWFCHSVEKVFDSWFFFIVEIIRKVFKKFLNPEETYFFVVLPVWIWGHFVSALWPMHYNSYFLCSWMIINFLVSNIYFDYCFVSWVSNFFQMFTSSKRRPQQRHQRLVVSDPSVVWCCTAAEAAVRLQLLFLPPRTTHSGELAKI